MPFVLAVLLITAGLWFMRQNIYQILVTHHLNEVFSEFTVKDLQGSAIRSSEFKNKVLVLDFWATWCSACREAFPEFQDIYEEYREHPEVVFLAINTSRAGDTPENVRQFIDRHRYTFPVAYDEGSKLSDQLAIGYHPTLLIIDQAGKLRLRHVGYLKTLEDYRSILRKHIKEVLSLNQKLSSLEQQKRDEKY
jgi:thiol-disulfide isomerase/thioredoxin